MTIQLEQGGLSPDMMAQLLQAAIGSTQKQNSQVNSTGTTAGTQAGTTAGTTTGTTSSTGTNALNQTSTGSTKNLADISALQDVFKQQQAGISPEALSAIFSEGSKAVPGLIAATANAVGARSSNNTPLATALTQLSTNLTSQAATQSQAMRNASAETAAKIAALTGETVTSGNVAQTGGTTTTGATTGTSNTNTNQSSTGSTTENKTTDLTTNTNPNYGNASTLIGALLGGTALNRAIPGGIVGGIDSGIDSLIKLVTGGAGGSGGAVTPGGPIGGSAFDPNAVTGTGLTGDALSPDVVAALGGLLTGTTGVGPSASGGGLNFDQLLKQLASSSGGDVMNAGKSFSTTPGGTPGSAPGYNFDLSAILGGQGAITTPPPEVTDDQEWWQDEGWDDYFNG